MHITFQLFKIHGGKQLLPTSTLIYKAPVTSKQMLLSTTPPYGNLFDIPVSS